MWHLNFLLRPAGLDHKQIYCLSLRHRITCSRELIHNSIRNEVETCLVCDIPKREPLLCNNTLHFFQCLSREIRNSNLLQGFSLADNYLYGGAL